MEIVFFRQAYHFIKKAAPPLKEKIKEEVLKIAKNPQLGNFLRGKSRSLRSHHFRFVKTQYRIAYLFRGKLMIVAIASRENFYRDLERNL